jgi:hypothetical protein
MRRVCWLLVAVSAMAEIANAQQVVEILADDPRSFSIELPASAFSHAGASLAVDVNGYDLTPFARLEDDTLRVQLATPLDPGQYGLSILLLLPDGDAEVLLDATLEVIAAEGMQWSANAMLQTSFRVAEEPEEAFDGLERVTTKGSLSHEAEHLAGAWQLESALDVIYDRQNPSAPAGEEWLLPDIELGAAYRGNSATTSVTAGSVAVSQQNLLFSRFQRRGARLATAATPGQIELQAFSVVSAPSNLIKADQLLPGDGDNRSDGLAASVQLVDERLQVSGAFIDGRTPLGGAGFNDLDDAAVYGGDSWNVRLDSRLAGGSVVLQLEHAESNFDADGIGIGAPARRDDATSATLLLSSMGRLGSGPFSYWSAELQHRRVGLDFYSIGNLALPGNLEVHSAYLQAGFRDLTVDLDLARERTNPAGNPLMPTQTLDRSGISFAYAPGVLDPEHAVWRWLGAPSLTSWLYRLEHSQPDADAMLAGFDLDNTTREFGVGISFARDRLNWSLQLGVIDYMDRSEAVFEGEFLLYQPLSDSRNLQASVQAVWAATERLTIDAHAQRNKFEETDFDNDYRNTLYGAGATVQLLPERLSLRGSVHIGRDRSHFGDALFMPEQLNSSFADLQLVWHAIAARPGRAGLSMNLSGSYARNEDLAFLVDDEMWSVFLGARLDWTR